MNIGGLFGALTPVFFVLALGYFAGKRNAFDADQSAGLSKLALTFALPASLFARKKRLRNRWRSSANTVFSVSMRGQQNTRSNIVGNSFSLRLCFLWPAY
jgi:predicted permease